MNRKTALIVLCSCILFILCGTELNSANSQEKAGQGVLEHEVSVVLKLVQVYVLDKQGNAVTDLEKEDFDLYDNGKLKSITDFEKHVLFMGDDATQPPLKEKASSPAKLNRKFFLFFDLAFNTARGIKNAREAALYFIDHQLQPTDEVGVLSYSATKYFTVHEYLTTNHKKVREAVEGIGIKDMLGRAEDAERRYWGMIREMAQPYNSSLSEIDRLLQMNEFNIIKSNRLMAKHHVVIFSRVMKAFGQALSHIQGHKNILYLSAGIPSSMFKGDAFQSGFDDFNLNDRYDEMIKTLAASDTSVYPLYAEGTNAGWDPSSGFVDRQQLGKSSLQKLAAETGGKYFGNIQSYETIMEEIQNATSSFYVLGYSIGETWDGKYHEITVKVRRKGCRVQAQAGYFSPKPFRQLSAFEKKLNFLDLALEEKSQFLAPRRFPVETICFSAEGMSGLVTLAKISASAVQELSGKKVELINLIFDEEDNLRHFKGWRIDLTKLPQKDVFYYSLASFPPGKYKSRIVLRNTQTGRSAVSSAQVVIPEPKDTGLKLSSPLLLIPEENAAYLKGELIEQQDTDKKRIGLTDLYPCNFNSFVPIVGEVKQGVSRLIAVIRSYVPESRSPNMKISLRVMDQSTDAVIPIPFSVSQRNPENHTQISFIDIQSDQFKPGKYVLHFDAEETVTGLKSRASAAFSVK